MKGCCSRSLVNLFIPLRVTAVVGGSLALAVCGRAGDGRADGGCHAPVAEIIVAALEDKELQDYAPGYFDQKAINRFVWDGPESNVACENAPYRFSVSTTARFDHRQGARLALVEILHRDDDAAFIQFALLPTGKRTELLLRKAEGKWRVTQRNFYEN